MRLCTKTMYGVACVNYPEAIAASGLSIYDPIEIGDPELWIPTPDLEELLDRTLSGADLAGLANRTRSKRVKELICQALGYPVPGSFRKTQPRFPGQQFDAYTQKSNNLQIWNEELSPTRRYVLIRPDGNGNVVRVKVVTGEDLALLDRTGTLTSKYQARLSFGSETAELVTPVDTENLLSHVELVSRMEGKPTAQPRSGRLLPIAEVFSRLQAGVGASFPDAGIDQERNRGAVLHELVCELLGYASYADDGRFPDVRNQLLEVKLQTATTIDLGLVSPSSTEPLDVTKLGDTQVRHCDVRYAMFYGETDGSTVTLTHLFLTNGKGFHDRFEQFQGKVQNAKLQIPLPRDFFDR